MGMIEINWKPDRRTLRQFGLIGLAVFGGLCALTTSKHGVDWRTWALGAGAAYCGLGALALPAALKPLFVGMSVAGAPIGWVVSHVILAIVYFLILTPLGLVMKLIGRDSMERRFDRAAKTYWVARRTDVESARYFRQS